MDQSMTLLSARIQFLETELALIHIPLHLYNHFLQPILAIITPVPSDLEDVTDHAASHSWPYEHPFVNISVTPVECSVVCSREVATKFFAPVRDALIPQLRYQCCISDDDYVAMQVYGDTVDAGQRVLELTGPLAMNGISIFFITTYFSDYILVPLRSRPTVVSALESRGFAFESYAEAFVNIASPTSLHSHTHSHRSASNPQNISYFPAPFTTPPTAAHPTSSIADLQSHTFATLRLRNIRPKVDPTLLLVQCAAYKEDTPHANSHGAEFSTPPSSAAKLLHLGLLRCLIALPRPRFLSLTLTDTEPLSLLLEQRLLRNFPLDAQGESVLLGNVDDLFVAITLDLRDLPEESTGIVCGVAGRLVGATSRPDTSERGGWRIGGGAGGGGGSSGHIRHTGFQGSVEMSYLSTARAGTVIVTDYELQRAMEALEEPFGEEDKEEEEEEG